MIKVGDKVKVTTEARIFWTKCLAESDSILQTSVDTVYIVTKIEIVGVELVPDQDRIKIGSDNLLTDLLCRYILKGWLVESDINKTFVSVDSKSFKTFDYCSCEQPTVVWNTVFGEQFQFCRKCKKERKA